MLRLQPDQERDTIWDALLPAGVTLLPPDLAAIDALLADPALLAPFRTLWRERDAASGQHAEAFGRPTLAMATYVRLMVIKSRTGWGYMTLVREVSDSLHLRRFCLIPLGDPVPTESAVRKLTRRLGPELVAQLTREVIELAVRERRFAPRALRIDSTVVEADIRYPTDSGLAADGVRLLAGAARALARAAGAEAGHVRDRSRSIGRRLRALGRTLRRRTGEAQGEVLRLTGEAGDLLARSIGEARRMVDRVANETEPEIRAAREQLRRARRARWPDRRPDRSPGAGRADQRPAGLVRRPRCPADPQGQAREPHPVRLHQPDRRTHRRHGPRGPRPRPAAADPGGLGPRERAPAGDDRRARPNRAAATRGGGRRGLRDPGHPRGVRALRRHGPRRRQRHQRRVTTHPSQARLLPGRRRGSDQPPQTLVRPPALEAPGRDRRGHLDELGDPRLRPRHHSRPAGQTTPLSEGHEPSGLTEGPRGRGA